MAKGIMVIVVGTVLCLLLLAGNRRQNRPSEYVFSEDASDGGYTVREAALQEQFDGMETGYHRIQINARPEMTAGEPLCNLMIGNPKENHYDIQAELLFEETGEVIYVSEIIAPGNRQAYSSLEQVPEPGEYPMLARFYLLESGTQQVCGEIEAELVLTVR